MVRTNSVDNAVSSGTFINKKYCFSITYHGIINYIDFII